MYVRNQKIGKRKWNNQDLETAVRTSSSFRAVIKKLNLVPAGGNYAQVKRYIKELSLNTNHFKGKGWNKGNTGGHTPLYSLEEVLIKNSSYQSYKLKNRLFWANIKKPKCEICGWAQYSEDGRLPLELDHINGDRMDNRIENLRVLCPNCHSLQPTHRGRNRKK